MEEIHELYKKYKDNNFTILSFAMGDSKDRLNEFWDKKWQMPWFNASLINGWKDKTAKEFIVLGIPFLLLVNPDGNVVENNLSFRYKNIDEVISKYLK
jgi:hypothetical protein